MKKVIILRGISGSGKTWHARHFRQLAIDKGLQAIIISTDDFWMVNGEYQFDVTRLGDTHADSCKRFIQACDDNFDLIIVDNTNIKVWELAPYRLIAFAYKYEVKFYRIECTKQVAIKRCTHSVPAAAIHRQQAHMEDLPFYGESEEVILND